MFQFLKNLFGPTKTVEKEVNKHDYLRKLAENLEEIKNNNKIVLASIIEIKAKGFVIKTSGLFGFISFEYMPWQYKNIQNWASIAPYLIGKRFFCSIHSIEVKERIGVIVNGQAHKFYPIELEEGAAYSCIILQKTIYGLFLEVGYHFNWKYGSLVGLAHISTFTDIDTFNNAKNGDIITTYFQGFTVDNKLILGDNVEGLDFLTGKVDRYIDTVVDVIVKKEPDKKTEYFVEGKYPATLSVTKAIYPDDKKQIKKAVANFKDNEKISCKVIGINARQKRMQIKLTDEYKKYLEFEATRGFSILRK